MTKQTPAPHPAVSYRPASQKTAPGFRDDAHRRSRAAAFSDGADVYEDVRPGYPREVVELLATAKTVVDVGAGTGKLTRDLTAPGRDVLATDPSADMVRTLSGMFDVPVWRATAEATALADDSVDAVVCAQTWHWVDVAAASAEFDRIVRPGGQVVLVWNTIDVSDPWVLRLARIMHSGDIHKEGFLPRVTAPWEVAHEVRLTWTDPLTPAQVYRLTQTRSYWLRSGEKIRRRVRENLRWYLFEHTGLREDSVIDLPYRTDAFVLRRAHGR